MCPHKATVNLGLLPALGLITVNKKQQVALGLFLVVAAWVVLYPPWVYLLRDRPGERHEVYLGRAPVWAPPTLRPGRGTSAPRPAELDLDVVVTSLLAALVVFGLVGWFLGPPPAMNRRQQVAVVIGGLTAFLLLLHPPMETRVFGEGTDCVVTYIGPDGRVLTVLLLAALTLTLTVVVVLRERKARA